MVADWQSVVDRLSSVGPATAYVGFSMGAVFGFPVVASLPTIAASVFIAGGIPGHDWTDDPALEPLLIDTASRLGRTHVLMLNREDDELFPAQDARRLYDSIVATSKELLFSPGSHDEWHVDLIDTSVNFLNERGAAAGSWQRERCHSDNVSGGDERGLSNPERPAAALIRSAANDLDA